MAKRICRTADRFDPTGMPRPRCCVRRATPPSCTAVVYEISQRDKDAFIFGKGCAGLARRQTGRDHSLPPGPGRAAPPICSDLIYDRHKHQHGPRGVLLHAPFAGIQKPEAFSKSRFVRAGSARNLAGVFQKTALFSAGAANFKSLASTISATSSL